MGKSVYEFENVICKAKAKLNRSIGVDCEQNKFAIQSFALKNRGTDRTIRPTFDEVLQKGLIVQADIDGFKKTIEAAHMYVLEDVTGKATTLDDVDPELWGNE